MVFNGRMHVWGVLWWARRPLAQILGPGNIDLLQLLELNQDQSGAFDDLMSPSAFPIGNQQFLPTDGALSLSN
jgi:hypothetical protein